MSRLPPGPTTTEPTHSKAAGARHAPRGKTGGGRARCQMATHTPPRPRPVKSGSPSHGGRRKLLAPTPPSRGSVDIRSPGRKKGTGEESWTRHPRPKAPTCHHARETTTDPPGSATQGPAWPSGTAPGVAVYKLAGGCRSPESIRALGLCVQHWLCPAAALDKAAPTQPSPALPTLPAPALLARLSSEVISCKGAHERARAAGSPVHGFAGAQVHQLSDRSQAGHQKADNPLNAARTASEPPEQRQSRS
mmetsp:Transcript_93329/g.249899  ORF Transcript_93329/g.249899 Transcript_93329/m.249899 type:complete len:249 (-) Transcript_93329:614-1360(-)